MFKGKERRRAKLAQAIAAHERWNEAHLAAVEDGRDPEEAVRLADLAVAALAAPAEGKEKKLSNALAAQPATKKRGIACSVCAAPVRQGAYGTSGPVCHHCHSHYRSHQQLLQAELAQKQAYQDQLNALAALRQVADEAAQSFASAASVYPAAKDEEREEAPPRARLSALAG